MAKSPIEPGAVIIDQIVVGARQNSMLRTQLGRVSTKVAAEAPCTVTVVRPPQLAAAQEQENLSVTPDTAAN
jgi:eukaryotic-like serine/threonine-protein kinase